MINAIKRASYEGIAGPEFCAVTFLYMTWNLPCLEYPKRRVFSGFIARIFI